VGSKIVLKKTNLAREHGSSHLLHF